MKNVLKTFAIALVCIAAMTGTSYANTAKEKTGKKMHHKSASAKHVTKKADATK